MTEKKEQKKQQRRIVMKDIAEYVGWYTLLFALVSAGVFVWFIKNQKSFCWTTDTSSQYIPKASYFITWTKEMLHRLLNGEQAFRMYDFCIGMGDSVPLHMEPLYWLYLLFDESQIEFAYGFLIVLRFYLAGLSLTVFLKYFRYDRWQCLTGSLVYATQSFYYTDDHLSNAASCNGRDLSKEALVSVYCFRGSQSLVWILLYLYEYPSDGSIFSYPVFLWRGKEKCAGIPASDEDDYLFLSSGNWNCQYYIF